MVGSLFQKQKQSLDFFFEKIDIDKTQLIIQEILSSQGMIYFTGVGKSGLIAKKIAMTFVSTGTKAFFLSPHEALHGDIGLIEQNDLVICLSKSGDTKELLNLIPFIRKKGAKIIAVVSHPYSKLAKRADLSIILPLKNEICPYNLAPTTSTSLQLIFGDILAVFVMENKKISMEKYADNHPSGNIGKKMILQVKDLMLTDQDLPLCSPEDNVLNVLPTLSEKKCGAILAVDEQKHLIGIFTDGDLRRSIEKYGQNFLHKKIREVMTKHYKFIHPNQLAVDAMDMMEEKKKLVTVLPVLENKKVIGIIRMHDIIQSGLKEN